MGMEEWREKVVHLGEWSLEDRLAHWDRRRIPGPLGLCWSCGAQVLWARVGHVVLRSFPLVRSLKTGPQF